jgi:hypothetical protein
MCIPFFLLSAWCVYIYIYIDFTPASSDRTSPGLHFTVSFLPCCCGGSHDDEGCMSSWASSPVQQQFELQSNISRLSTSSWMIKWSVSRLWCKCLVVTITRAIFSWIPILSLPCPFSQQIQYLKSVTEKQTLAVCASSCFMTPETVEVCHMFQTGMILQCRNSA